MVIKTSKGVIISGNGSTKDDLIPTIIFLETSKSGSARDALRAAHRLGYNVVVLTRRNRDSSKYPEVNQMIQVQDFSLNSLSKQIMALKKQGRQLKAILSFVEPYVYLAASLAESQGLNLLSSEAMMKMEDKILTRNTLENTTYNPYYAIINDRTQLPEFVEEHANMVPLVLKSPKASGSGGVLLAEDAGQLQIYANHLFNRYPGHPILVEEYLAGQQYLVEVLVYNDQVNIVAVIEQEITFHQRFIVTGYLVLANSSGSLFDELGIVVSSIMKEFGMSMGACHLELRLVGNEWKLIEANPRISGGAMNQMIKTNCGINLVKETVRLALGEVPNVQKQYSRYVFTQYLTVSSSGVLKLVTGRNRASRHPGVTDVYIKYIRGSHIGPPSSMGKRCGYVIATGETPEEAKQQAKAAASQIRFHLASPE